MSTENSNNNNNNNNEITTFTKEFQVDLTLKDNKNKDNVAKSVYRNLFCMDALEYIKNNELEKTTSIITSLPDIVEMSGYTLDRYKTWFVNAITLICSKLTDNNVAIFYQTDVKRKVKGNKGVVDEYLDKGYMCSKGAEIAGCKMVWHKMMTSSPPELGKVARGTKSSFSHMICIARTPSNLIYQEQTPDIAPRGAMTWPKAMGLNACMVAAKYIRGIGSTTILDPFCGKGSVLAIANLIGLNSIGVDLAISKVRHSCNLLITPKMIESFKQSDWKEINNSKQKSNDNVDGDDVDDDKEDNDSNNNNNDNSDDKSTTSSSTTTTTTSSTNNNNSNDTTTPTTTTSSSSSTITTNLSNIDLKE
ncbi:hypothetical protein PPL_08445 [Heterostelium album PN500]|uniref:Uncharacterized protein n=1 Tax=Heterostelium pallidum (strain ATCC 26659 / Pp 5 / PN500) TaxID=670386 RepID=D3BI77_HETP5|nr:hypothetical protein PPL_08445 [Heterostelium album PN500]EFA78977.1 hypothetical protein PPL_08445 [Heterostelium album PN500]|eukprot:XP_020431101.1 hypothetical protein PPL_08445 [Heterostelium album PN500]